MKNKTLLIDELFRLEILSEVQNLPRGQAEQTTHGEDAEVQHPRVGALVRVPHLFLALTHVSEILHDRLAQVL